MAVHSHSRMLSSISRKWPLRALCDILRVENGKSIEIAPVKIADGVLSTTELYSRRRRVPIRFLTGCFPAYNQTGTECKYHVCHSAGKCPFLRDQQRCCKGFEGINGKLCRRYKNYAIENVQVSAYASPDGGVKLNDRLASQRETNAAKYIGNEIKKAKIETEVESNYTAQDWEVSRSW